MKTFIAGINGVDKSSGNPVFIDANGQLGHWQRVDRSDWPDRTDAGLQPARLVQPAQMELMARLDLPDLSD